MLRKLRLVSDVTTAIRTTKSLPFPVTLLVEEKTLEVTEEERLEVVESKRLTIGKPNRWLKAEGGSKKELCELGAMTEFVTRPGREEAAGFVSRLLSETLTALGVEDNGVLP